MALRSIPRNLSPIVAIAVGAALRTLPQKELELMKSNVLSSTVLERTARRARS